MRVNQQQAGGRWFKLGDFDFKRNQGTVELRNKIPKGSEVVIADAVKITKWGEPSEFTMSQISVQEAQPTPRPSRTPTPSPVVQQRLPEQSSSMPQTVIPGEGIIIDNDEGYPVYQEKGEFGHSKRRGYNDGTYRFVTSGKQSRAIWTVNINIAGAYDVYATHRAAENRAKRAAFAIYAAEGPQVAYVDQTKNNNQWVKLGTYEFNKGDTRVILDASRSSGAGYSVVIADAVKLKPNFEISQRANTTIQTHSQQKQPQQPTTRQGNIPTPFPTPTPQRRTQRTNNSGIAAVTMHVHAIRTATESVSGNKKIGKVEIVIVDNIGHPVKDAQVIGKFSGDYKGEVKLITDEQGRAITTWGNPQSSPVAFTFRVNNVFHPSLKYTPLDNRMTYDHY